MKHLSVVILSIFCLSLLSSCTKDKEAPVISDFKLNGVANSNFSTTMGMEDSLQIDFNISDNEGLYKCIFIQRFIISSNSTSSQKYETGFHANGVEKEGAVSFTLFPEKLENTYTENGYTHFEVGKSSEVLIQVKDINGNLLEQDLVIEIE